MPQTGNRYNRKDNKHDDKKKDKDGKGFVIAKFKFLAKRLLAAYPDEDGVPFYLGDAADEGEFFNKGFLMGTCRKDNCELFHRLGMALNLDAASMDEGVKLMGTVAPSSAAAGIANLTDHLAENGAFKKAIHVLNAGTSSKPSKTKIKKAVKEYCTFFRENQDLRNSLASAATYSAKLYLMSMTFLQHMDFHANRKRWAKRMEGDQSSQIKKWMKDPTNEDKLIAALTESFDKKIKSNKKGKQKRKADTDDDTESDNDSSECDEDSEKPSAMKSDDAKMHGEPSR